MHTDASTTGLGAALYQEQDGRKRAIAFASRGLTKSEAKYPAHKLEFLALKWAVTAKFSDYLYGTEFTVITDSTYLHLDIGQTGRHKLQVAVKSVNLLV